MGLRFLADPCLVSPNPSASTLPAWAAYPYLAEILVGEAAVRREHHAETPQNTR